MVDINIGAISEALNNKTDRNMRNVDTGVKADSVIDYQEPTAGNGYTWYRKYASGWVEQGGYIDNGTNGAGAATITLPVEMLDTNYTAQMTPAVETSGSSPRIAILKSNLTTTTITLNWYSYTNTKAYWQVSGYAA